MTHRERLKGNSCSTVVDKYVFFSLNGESGELVEGFPSLLPSNPIWIFVVESDVVIVPFKDKLGCILESRTNFEDPVKMKNFFPLSTPPPYFDNLLLYRSWSTLWFNAGE